MKRSLPLFKTVLVTAVLLFHVGCDDNENQQPPDAKGTISSAFKEVNEQQVVQLSIQGFTLDNETYPARFGDIDIELFRTDDQQLAFVIPAQVGSGSFDLTTTIASNKLSFNVTEVVLSQTPDEIVDAFVGPDPDLQFEGYIATAQQLMFAGLTSSNEVDLFHTYHAQLTQALEEYRKLPADEKVAVAKFLTANASGISELNAILTDLNSNALAISNGRTAGACDDLTFKVDKVKCGVVLLLDGFIALGSGLGAAVLSTNPLGIAIATGILAYVTIPAVLSFKQNAMAILNSRVQADLVEAGVFSGRIKDDVLQTHRPYAVDLRVLKTNFQKNDINSDVSWVKELLSTVENFRVMWDDLRPKIKSTELMPFHYPDSSAALEPSESMDFLSVEVLDNPDITAALSEENGQTLITFSGSGTGTFQYVFHYDDGSFQAESEPLTGTLDDASFIEFTIDGVTYRGTGSNNGGSLPGTYYKPLINEQTGGQCGPYTPYLIHISGVGCADANNCARFVSTIGHASEGQCGFIPLSEKTYVLGSSDSCVPCNPVLTHLEITRSGYFMYFHADSESWVTISEITDDYFTGSFSFTGCQQIDTESDGCNRPTPYYCCKTSKTIAGSFRIKFE